MRRIAILGALALGVLAVPSSALASGEVVLRASHPDGTTQEQAYQQYVSTWQWECTYWFPWGCWQSTYVPVYGYSWTAWFTPTTSQSGQGNGAYQRLPGTDWLCHYDYGNCNDEQYTNYRTTFDLPSSGSWRVELRSYADNQITGVSVNGASVGGATDCSAFGGSPNVVTIPSSDLQATGNTLQINVKQCDGSWITTGGVDFAVVAVPLDTTPPDISADVQGTQGNNGWYTSDASVHWNVSDPESAISNQSGCGDQSVTSDTSGVTFTCTATSAGGTASKSVTIKRDATPPAITFASLPSGATSDGWYNGPVKLGWSCSDATSGVVSDGDSQTISSEGANQSATGTCTDLAGNQSSDKQAGVNIDTTPPVVSYSGNAGTYTVADAVNISCNATDALSGVASSTCQNISGDAYTFSLGNNSYSASATDKAGNVGSGSTSFTVTVDTDSLCSLTKRWVTNAGVAGALCAKLDAAKASIARGDTNSKNGQLGAYGNQLSAQSGKSIPADKAAILIKLSQAI